MIAPADTIASVLVLELGKVANRMGSTIYMKNNGGCRRMLSRICHPFDQTRKWNCFHIPV